MTIPARRSGRFRHLPGDVLIIACIMALATAARLGAQAAPPALATDGCTPKYPAALKAAGFEGSVLLRFVVDRKGRAESERLTIVRSTHDLLTQSVLACLPSITFLPAEVDGHTVRQLVEQRFDFKLRR